MTDQETPWSASLASTSMLRDIGPLGPSISEHNGESRRVCRLLEHPSLLYKEYLQPLGPSAISSLDALVEWPSTLGVADRAVLKGGSAWPLTRVVDDQGRAVGVVMPIAADRYFLSRVTKSGQVRQRPLEIDLLALTSSQQAQRAVPTQDLISRTAICRSITRTAVLLARSDIIYLDWSYSNVFWSDIDKSAFLIDLDGCSIGPRKQIETPNWEDPLVPVGTLAGTDVDSYRVALLVARCLTGSRTVGGAVSEMLTLAAASESYDTVAHVIVMTLNARHLRNRASVADLDATLELAATGVLTSGATTSQPLPAQEPNPGVTGWKPVRGRKPTSTPRAGSLRAGPSSTTPQAAPAPTLRPVHTAPPEPLPQRRTIERGAVVRFVFSAILLLAVWVLSFVLAY
jgi:hypothetical protein